MRYVSPNAVDDWLLLETVHRGKNLCSDRYASANNEDLIHVFSALRLLMAAGCPPDECRGRPKTEHVGKYTPAGAEVRVAVFVLKAKPSGWRLYFYVLDRDKRQVEFIHSVQKKTNARDPKDFERCCRVLDKIWAGKTTKETLFIPDR